MDRLPFSITLLHNKVLIRGEGVRVYVCVYIYIFVCLMSLFPTRGNVLCLPHLLSIPEYGAWILVGAHLAFVGLTNEKMKEVLYEAYYRMTK